MTRPVFISSDFQVLLLISTIVSLIAVIACCYRKEDWLSLVYPIGFFYSFSYLLRLSNQILEIPFSYFLSESDFQFWAQSSVFLIFALIALHRFFGILSSILFAFFISVCAALLFPLLSYFCFESQPIWQVYDQGQWIYLLIFTGAAVWTSEMFLPKSIEPEDSKSPRFLALLFFALPIALFSAFPKPWDADYFSLQSKGFYLSMLSLFVFQLRLALPKEASFSYMFPILWPLSFWTVRYESSMLLLFPLVFGFSFLFPFLALWLQTRHWRQLSAELVSALLVSAAISVYLPFLLSPESEWNHSPYVMFGVQTLYLLSNFLVGSIFVATMLFFQPRKRP
ncbi:hypothetical protein [Leptospira ryugenii]|uniref:hypothetical protein n=1 Tax=Leptospira ryugenii TaxID=1917863 RepID=UPI000D5A06C3|nr:hypothetical protein [Leptospira ryugenii]